MDAGREMDALVAERVMGWAIFTHNEGPNPPYWYREETDNHSFHLPIPKFSTDIAAAYAMEERIEELGLTERYIVELARIACGYDGLPETLIRLQRGLYEDQIWAMVHASPADRCRAALRAVEEGQDDN